MPVLPGAFTHSYSPLFLPLHRSRRPYLWSVVHAIHASLDRVTEVYLFDASIRELTTFCSDLDVITDH